MTADMIKSYFVTRFFYRETEDLTRDYKEGAPYPRPGANYRYFGDDPGQQTRYHYDDLLIFTHYSISRNGISIIFSWDFPGVNKRFKRWIPDINSYFADSDSKMVEDES